MHLLGVLFPQMSGFQKGICSGIVLSDVTWAVKNRPYERCGKHPIDTPGDDALLRARPRLLTELLEAQRFFFASSVERFRFRRVVTTEVWVATVDWLSE